LMGFVGFATSCGESRWKFLLISRLVAENAEGEFAY